MNKNTSWTSEKELKYSSYDWSFWFIKPVLFIKKVVLFIVSFFFTFTLGVFFTLIGLSGRFFSVWFISKEKKEEMKMYHIRGEFNEIQYVLNSIGSWYGETENE